MRTVVDPDTGEIVSLSTTRPDHNPASLAEVHELVAHYCEALDDALPDLNLMTTEAAGIEADFIHARATALVGLVGADAGKARGDRMTVGEREARADLAAEDEHRLHLLASARVRAHREYLHTLRSQLSAYQTVARALGGLT